MKTKTNKTTEKPGLKLKAEIVTSPYGTLMPSLTLEAPREMPYGDRRAMVRDRWGNTWQIATHGGRFT